MEEVYINDISEPFVLEVDGRLSLAPLRMDPATTSIQSKMALVGPDSVTKRTWSSLLRGLQAEGEEELGSRANPLQVAGTSLSGTAEQILFIFEGAFVLGGKGSAPDVPLDMIRFAEWVAQAADTNDNDPWLQLPKGIYFLGFETLGSCLYVREAYRKLADVLERMRAKGKRHAVVGGTPGLGKSWFALWMLVRWLREGIDVLWHTSTNEFFLFKDGTVTGLLEREAFAVLKTASDLHYIADGAKPYVLLEVRQSFVAHSPDTSKYKEYMKRPNAANAPLYMPHWEDEELEIVRATMHPQITNLEMTQLLGRRGAVPRYVLTEAMWSDMDDWLEEALTGLKWDDIIDARPGSNKASHRIAAIHPTRWREGNFFKHELRFLSVAVHINVTSRMLKINSGGLQQLMLLVNKCAKGLAADFGNCMEESVVHAILQEGGQWVLRKCLPRFNRGPMSTGKLVGEQPASSSVQVPSSSAAKEGTLDDYAMSELEADDQDHTQDSGSDLSNPVVLGEDSSSSSSSSSSDTLFTLPSLPVWYFTYAEQLECIPEFDVYAQPRIINFPAIDAIIISGRTAYLIQVTRNSSHTINIGTSAKCSPTCQATWRCNGSGCCPQTCGTPAASTCGHFPALIGQGSVQKKHSWLRTACRHWRCNTRWQLKS